MKRLIIFVFAFVLVISFSGSVLGVDCNRLNLLMHFDQYTPIGESNTYAYDWSNTGNNLTCSFCPTITADSKFGHAYNFSVGHFSISDASQNGLDMQSGEFTISNWVKINTLPTANWESNAIIDKYGASGNRAYSLNVLKWGVSPFTVVFRCVTQNRIDNVNPARAGANDGNSIQTGIWYHVGCTLNNATGEFVLWINGINATPTTNVLALPYSIIDSTSPFVIGDDYNLGNDFKGIIDEVAIWNRSLSATEIWDLYYDEVPISCATAQTCTDAGGTCQTNTCDAYTDCSSLVGDCATGHCCFGTCTASTTCSSADDDKNGVVSINELINYISQWKSGEVLIGELITAIGEWKSGCS